MEQQLANRVATATLRFELSGGRDTAHLFEALTYIAHYWWDRERDQSDGLVMVPFWCVDVLAQAWLKYRDEQELKKRTTFGKTMGLEGKRGARSAAMISKRENRDIRIVLAIAFKMHEGTSLNRARQEVGQMTALGEENIRKIWRRLGRRATQLVRGG